MIRYLLHWLRAELAPHSLPRGMMSRAMRPESASSSPELFVAAFAAGFTTAVSRLCRRNSRRGHHRSRSRLHRGAQYRTSPPPDSGRGRGPRLHLQHHLPLIPHIHRGQPADTAPSTPPDAPQTSGSDPESSPRQSAPSPRRPCPESPPARPRDSKGPPRSASARSFSPDASRSLVNRAYSFIRAARSDSGSFCANPRHHRKRVVHIRLHVRSAYPAERHSHPPARYDFPAAQTPPESAPQSTPADDSAAAASPSHAPPRAAAPAPPCRSSSETRKIFRSTSSPKMLSNCARVTC